MAVTKVYNHAHLSTASTTNVIWRALSSRHSLICLIGMCHHFKFMIRTCLAAKTILQTWWQRGVDGQLANLDDEQQHTHADDWMLEYLAQNGSPRQVAV